VEGRSPSSSEALQGRQNEKRAIAKNLLAVLDDAAIAAITGLTVEDVQTPRNA